MQRPTEPHSTAEPPAARGDEGELYRRHHRDLQRAVARVVNAPRELIEDACQSAWSIMLRRQPGRAAIFAWLRVVAVHEAYRLCAAQRDAHLEDIAHGDGWEGVIGDRITIDEAIEARHALRRLAELPERQRRDLSLRVAGYSYREIGEITGGRTYTKVNVQVLRTAPSAR